MTQSDKERVQSSERDLRVAMVILTTKRVATHGFISRLLNIEVSTVKRLCYETALARWGVCPISTAPTAIAEAILAHEQRSGADVLTALTPGEQQATSALYGACLTFAERMPLASGFWINFRVPRHVTNLPATSYSIGVNYGQAQLEV